MSRHIQMAISMLVLVSGVALLAQDWPQWRGLHRDGVLGATAGPASWPEHLKLRWKVTVGLGHASPILASGRVYLITRQQSSEVVTSIHPANGKPIWQQAYPAPYTMNPAAEGHGPGPKSTPVFWNGRLYTLGISGILTSWDAASGALRWRKEFSKLYGATSPDFGAAMSPVVDKGMLIAHVGGHDSGALTAFDAESGDMRWRWTGDGPAYASPLVVELGGVRQIVTETQNNIVGVSATDGKLLWKVPFTTEYDQNIPTPVVYHDQLIVSGIAKGIMAIRPSQKAGQWSVETVWRNKDASLYMSSPVAMGDLLFGFSQYKKGQLFCLDARTGVAKWEGPPRQGDNAAVLISGENLVVLKNEGELIVARATAEGFEPVHHYTVADSPTWAHPLVLRNGVVIKDATTLALWTVD